jgi:hypothetical protein
MGSKIRGRIVSASIEASDPDLHRQILERSVAECCFPMDDHPIPFDWEEKFAKDCHLH